MLTLEDKRRIYQLLTASFRTEEEYSFEKIDALLNKNGYRSADFGYPKRRNMLEELTEFLTLREAELGRNRHLFATLHFWKDGADAAAQSPASAGAGEAAAAHSPAAPDAREAATAQSPASAGAGEAAAAHSPASAGAREEGVLTEKDKREIYEILTAAFPFEQQRHMAAISKCLSDEGYGKERFGFIKMKPMLASMPGFLSMEEQPMNGVPQTLITLHRVPEWEHAYKTDADGADAPADGGGLPAELEGQALLIPKTLAKLNQLVTGVQAQPAREILDALALDYKNAVRTGTGHRRQNAYVFPLRLKGLDGEDLIASIKPTDRADGPRWVLNFAGYASAPAEPGRQLELFAYCGTWANFLDELAAKALPESWDFEGARKSKFILFEYIKYTFYRLQLEDKICFSDDRSFAAFNTGLVTRHYDDIYACFEPIHDERYRTKWRFLEFCTAASRGLGKWLVDYFHPLPQPASYFTSIDDLFFDSRKELHTDFEHILLDNISRLPIEFLKEECRGVPEALEALRRISEETDYFAKKRLYRELSGLLDDTPRLYNRLRNRLEDAIELAKKRARWNFKTAIPCYTPRKNTMSLMLPLSLQDDARADAALIVEATHSGNYQGQTILTMQQAYLDARLVCRPDSEWLNTSLIRSED